MSTDYAPLTSEQQPVLKPADVEMLARLSNLLAAAEAERPTTTQTMAHERRCRHIRFIPRITPPY